MNEFLGTASTGLHLVICGRFNEGAHFVGTWMGPPENVLLLLRKGTASIRPFHRAKQRSHQHGGGNPDREAQVHVLEDQEHDCLLCTSTETCKRAASTRIDLHCSFSRGCGAAGCNDRARRTHPTLRLTLAAARLLPYSTSGPDNLRALKVTNMEDYGDVQMPPDSTTTSFSMQLAAVPRRGTPAALSTAKCERSQLMVTADGGWARRRRKTPPKPPTMTPTTRAGSVVRNENARETTMCGLPGRLHALIEESVPRGGQGRK